MHQAAQRIVPLLVCLALSTVWAQGAPAAPPPPSGSPLVGVWRTSIPSGAGAPIDGVLTVSPDNRYREEMVIQGQLAGFWEGTIALAPDGTVTQTETGRSPLLCFQGRCEPNEGPTTTVSRLVARTPDSFTLHYQDPMSGQSFSLVWQRVAGAPQAGPAVPPVTGAPPLPQGPAAAPDPLGGRPPSAPASPWAGTYTDGDVTVHLAGPGMDYLERGGVRYPLRLQGDDRRLEGTFIGGDTPFPITIERAGEGIVLDSAGARFELDPVPAPVPAQPANPLGG